MLVSHAHRFIYTKTLKTAGTSVEAYFERYCVSNPGEGQPLETRDESVSEVGIVGARSLRANGKNFEWWNHMPAFQIKQKLGAKIFDAYFKFCCVRNPFDKALSAYYWYDAIGQLDVPKDLEEPKRFETWLEIKGPPGDRNKYAINERYCMDDVIRYEALSEGVERICNRLGVPFEPERLPTFKTGIRPKDRSIAEMFTQKARDIVAERYKFELELFNYDFPADSVAA